MVCGLASGAATGDLAVLALSLCGVGLYALCGMALAAVLALLGGYGLLGMAGTIVLFPVFMASWMPLQVI